MSASQETGEWTLEGPLAEVAEAAGARLRAETDEDADAARTAADALTHAATSAMEAGYALTEIARAEARGKDTIRHALRADALKLVERSGARARDTQTEHHRAIARATRLGLPMREIAQAAHVTHGTIRAITNRLASHHAELEAGSAAVDQQPPEEEQFEPRREEEQFEPRREEEQFEPRREEEQFEARREEEQFEPRREEERFQPRRFQPREHPQPQAPWPSPTDNY